MIIAVLGVCIQGLFNLSALKAQVPQSIAYQAIVRGTDGDPLTDQLVSMQMILHQGSESGSIVYCEKQTITTNPLGLVNLLIGAGTIVSGNFQNIDWSTGPYYLEVELDPEGGTAFVPMGTIQLVSVPYALYADEVSTVGSTDIINWNTAYGWGDHALAGYLSDFTESDPLWESQKQSYQLKMDTNSYDATHSWVKNQGFLTDFIESDTGYWNRFGTSITLKNAGDNLGLGVIPTAKLDVNGGVKMNGSVVMTGITLGGSTDTLILALNPISRQMYYKNAGDLGGGGSGGGESNTASNLGTGAGIFEQKSGVDLQFNSLKSTNSILDISEDDPDDVINFTLHQSHVNHNSLLNYVPQQHFYQKDIDTVALYHSGLLTATNGVLSDITNNSPNWNAAYSWGNHATMGYLTNEADGDPANELQMLTRAGNTVSLSKGGGEVSVDDADPDPINEIQTLAVNGDQLSISAGNTVIIPGDDWGSQTVITDATLTGDGTPANALHIAPQEATPGQVLTWNGTTWAPASASFDGWSLTGNIGTNPDDHFIGTIDNQPLVFRVSDFHAGIIDPVNNLVAFGPGALLANTSGDGNVAFGTNALFSNTTGNGNTAIGKAVMRNNTTGSDNVAIGVRALFFNQEGRGLVAVGDSALFNNEGNPVTNAGMYNTAVGSKALYSNSIGVDNTALGARALYSNKSNSRSTAIGCLAMYYADDRTAGRPTYNTAVGYEALKGSSIATDNYGQFNTAVGDRALVLNTSGNYNTANGCHSLYNNASGSYNTANGSHSLYSNISGNYNTAGGNLSLHYNTSGNANTATGEFSLFSNTTGNENTAMGGEALKNNTTGSNNIAMGMKALFHNTIRNNLVAIGDSALYNNGLGVTESWEAKYNTAVGSKVLYSNTIGSSNTAIGYQALYSNATGFRNTANGFQALYSNTTGSQNVAIGWHAGYYLTGGNDNIFIGSSSGPTSSQSIDSSMWLGITSENQPVLYGDLTDGRIGIGATSPHPSAKLEVNSNNKGFLLPRMTISEFQAILNPANSLLVYSVDDNHFYVNRGTPASPSWAMVNTEWGINGSNIYFLGNNVGIGTLNPDAKLEVAGQVKITGGNPGAGKVLTSDAGGLASWQTPSGLTLPFEGTISANQAAFKITNTHSSFPSDAIGIYGAATGLYHGIGVYGLDGSQHGVGIGVYGVAQSDSGFAVYGLATSSYGPTVGVRGVSDSWSGTGVYGAASSTTGCNIGVLGYTKSDNGYSGYFVGGMFSIIGNTGIGTITPEYELDVAGEANLNSGITSGVALRCNGDEALWYNETYFSWGYGASYNYFADPVTIGTSDEPQYTLVVNGTAAKTDGGSWSVLSDARLKNLLGNYDRGLEDIVRLQPVRFTYKEGNHRELDSEEEQIGFVAQDVRTIFPEAVSEAKDGYLDFNMHAVNVAMVNAIKELKAENDRLKAENQKMNLRLEKIEALMSLLTEN